MLCRQAGVLYFLCVCGSDMEEMLEPAGQMDLYCHFARGLEEGEYPLESQSGLSVKTR